MTVPVTTHAEVPMLPDPAADAALAVATTARKEARDALVEDALRAAHDALRVIRQTFDNKTADFDDACKTLPLVHRVLEHVDRMEAATKSTADLPRLSFHIVLDATMQEAPPRRSVRVTPVVPTVIDVYDLDD